MTPTAPLETELTPDLIDRVMKLSDQNLGRLVTLALERLDPPPEDPEVVKAAWRSELAKRIRDIQEGKVVLLDARESVAQLRRQIQEKYGP